MLLRSSAIITLVTALVGAISFVNQIVVASVFGASAEFDAYLLAISLPVLLSSIISSAFSYSIVPALVKSRAGIAYSQFCTLLLFCACAGASLVTAIGNVISPVVVDVMATALPDSVRPDVVRMARISWVTAGLVVISGFLSGMQLASKRFVLPYVVAALPYLGMISLSLAWGAQWGPMAIVWGMLIGYAICTLLLLIESREELSIRTLNFEYWRGPVKLFAQLPLTMVAMLMFGVHQFIDAYWASRLGESALSHLGYAQRLLIAVGGLLIAGPSAVIGLRISDALVKGNGDQFFADTLRTVRMVLIFGAAVAVILSMLATPIIQLLFQRGAFDERATEGVASVLPFMMLGMTGMLGVIILFRAIFAIPDVLGGAALGALATLLYFAFSGLLSQFYGIVGISIAYAASWWLVLITAFGVLWKDRLKSLASTENRQFLYESAVALACVGLATYAGRFFIMEPFQSIGFVSLFLRLLAVTLVAVLVFYLITIRLFRIRDVELIADFVFRRRVRS